MNYEFLAAMTFILYLDRSCINQAGPVIKKELGISETQKGHIFTAFALAYALFEIPAGRWGDRYGSRLTDVIRNVSSRSGLAAGLRAGI